MAEQTQRSRRELPKRWAVMGDLPRSEFTGYKQLATQTSIVGLRKDGKSVDTAAEGDDVEIFLERTPFYAESGGQIGDTGTITTAGGRVRVEDTQKPTDGVTAHLGSVVTGELRVGDDATASLDAARRRQIARHHSATHLLHKALRETLGDQVSQRGSWVGPDHTTFDIPLNRAITEDELKRINTRVSQTDRDGLPFHARHKSYNGAAAVAAVHVVGGNDGEVGR